MAQVRSPRQPPPAGCSFLRQAAANQRPAGLRRGASTNGRPVLQRLQCAQPAPGQGGGAGRPFTPAGAGVGEMVQLSWRVECRVLHSGACHNTLCPSCHTRPRPPARTSCAQSPGPRLQHSGPGPHCPLVRDGNSVVKRPHVTITMHYLSPSGLALTIRTNEGDHLVLVCIHSAADLFSSRMSRFYAGCFTRAGDKHGRRQIETRMEDLCPEFFV